MNAVLLLATLLPVLMAAAFLLGRHLQRRHLLRHELSPVSRQHLELFQGGQLNESAVESAKVRFRDLLERGEFETVEASLRPGTQFVVQVRALTELGTDDAGRILERQLQRRLTEDLVEQSWYWIDLASGLRSLNRSQSLPHLLRCAELAGEIPLGHFFAAETVCFLGFAGYVRQTDTRLGQAAVRVLHKALEGLRCGVQGQIVAEARLGEVLEVLWDDRPERVDPIVVRVFAETRRLHQRAGHLATAIGNETGDLEAIEWQMSRLAALEPSLSEYLDEAPRHLRAAMLDPAITPEQEHDVLSALLDLRAESAPTVLPLLSVGAYEHAELAVETLRWSRDERVGPWLREWAGRRIRPERRTARRPAPTAPSRPSVSELPYCSVLHALRGHPSRETEAFLVLASRDWDPTYRAAALSSLGWSEPFDQPELLLCLQDRRRDPNLEVRQAARAARARLGERQALHWFRQTLTHEDVQRVHEGIQCIATEGLMLLWPDLDRLADSEDPDVAHHAREALERLCEDLDFRR